MKDNLQKPLYADYKKYAWGRLEDDRLVLSRERLYEFADRLLILFSYFVLCAAFSFVGYNLPRPHNIIHQIILFLVFIVIAVLCMALYVRRFVYRFARFRVMWEDWSRSGAACENCDERGKFLRTKENRAAAFWSRFAFSALILAVAAAVALFYIFSWSMAEQRVKTGGLLQEFARIAEKQGDVSIDIDSHNVMVWSLGNESYIEIAPEDEEEFKRIFEELQWSYVVRLRFEDGSVHVFMHGWLQSRAFDVYIGKQ